jgi:hypothetical protein
LIRAAFIYRSPDTIPGVFDTLFGGLFVIKGIPLAAQLVVLVGLPLALWLLLAERLRHIRLAGRLAEAIAIGLFAVLTLFVLQPWDEVFINLRHAQNWARSGVFSFNAHSLTEGTVDFLPYLAIGVLHRLGLPLVELGFAMSFCGGLLCIAAARSLFVAWGLGRHRSAVVLLASTYATLIFNAANGFAASVFTAVILWAIHDLFFARARWRGWVWLALLPAIRLEGAWFSALLLGYDLWRHRPSLRARMAAPLVGLPTIALSFYRWRTFGSPIPVPIRYKAGLGSFFLTVVGARNAAADLVASGALIAVFLLALCHVLDPHPERERDRSRETLVGILALGCAPYYLSGGDWFPSYWGRYLLPFVLFTVCAAVARALTLGPTLSARRRAALIGFPCVLLALHVLWPISAYWKLGEQFFAHRRTLARIHEPTIGRGHYRVQQLSQLGNHLQRTTDPGAVIASSEIATIMYFADRDALDLLGVTNAEVARAPLRPFPSLLRRFPERSELPYLIFKRLQPSLLTRYRPPYLYTFDFMMRDLVEGIPHDEVTDADLFLGLRRWEKKLGGLVDELYGGVPAILGLGYRPFLVAYANDFTSLYFVSAAQAERHAQRLLSLGFQGGWVTAEQAQRSTVVVPLGHAQQIRAQHDRYAKQDE